MDNIYKNTRLQLTLLYFGIIFVIVVFFSSALVQSQLSQFGRIERYQENFYNTPQGQFILPSDGLTRLETILEDIRQGVIVRTIEIDLAIFIIAAILSYYLSGKTLEPIEQALQKQKQFIADASHELKTPLTAITTEAEVLLRSDRTNEQYKEFTKSVLEETKGLTQLTFQLLSIAKSDSHVDKLHLQKTDLATLVSIVNEKFEKIAAEKNVSITFIPPKEAMIVVCDKKKIIELFSIFLDNAIKYNVDHGQVTLTLEKATNGIVYTITDTGVGIPKKDITKIFDRFYRVADDRHSKGFGLGLSIAKDIAKQHNAIIDIQSTQSKGTTIHITFQNIQKADANGLIAIIG